MLQRLFRMVKTTARAEYQRVLNDAPETTIGRGQEALENVSSVMTKIALWLSLGVATMIFLLVLSLAILPWLTLKLMFWVGLGLAIVCFGVVLFFASKPAEIVDRGVNMLWISKLMLMLTRKYTSRAGQ